MNRLQANELLRVNEHLNAYLHRRGNRAVEKTS
jgi:hypothetical protein